MRMRKQEGYIGVETMVIAGLVIAAGFIAMAAVLSNLQSSAQTAHVDLDAADPAAFTV